MVYGYKGPFAYKPGVVTEWPAKSIGVYYCGYLNEQGQLCPVYIGVATSDGGVRDRLLDHLNEDYWPEASHFGYHFCDSPQEALNLESREIQTYKPKYNIKGK